jgi:hypothetical protein
MIRAIYKLLRRGSCWTKLELAPRRRVAHQCTMHGELGMLRDVPKRDASLPRAERPASSMHVRTATATATAAGRSSIPMEQFDLTFCFCSEDQGEVSPPCTASFAASICL